MRTKRPNPSIAEEVDQPARRLDDDVAPLEFTNPAPAPESGGPTRPDLSAQLDRIECRLARIERFLADLVTARTIKDWYSVGEVAKMLGLANFTVREHCRHGRLRAEKRACGRGRSREWVLSREELERYQNHGLLPLRQGAA